ncbi:MAG: putative transposase [Bacteroidota bacterium]
MENTIQFQEILGVDKKNPFFTLCKDPEQPDKLLVFFGLSLLEVIDDTSDSPSLKLLLARLYNSGVKAQSILDSFSVAYTSLRRWGAALKSGDSEKIISILAGRQHPRKLTPEIINFSRARFFSIYPDNHYSYSKVIRQEILEVFGITVSGESLRTYFSQWKDCLNTKMDSSLSSNEEPPQNRQEQNEQFIDAPLSLASRDNVNTAVACIEEQANNNHRSGDRSHEMALNSNLPEHNRNHVVDFRSPPTTANAGYQFCHHAGVLLFSHLFNQLANNITVNEPLIKQWLAAILLGAINIEQTKLLNYPSLGYFLGQVLANRHEQRQQLTEIAKTTGQDELLRYNGELVCIKQCSDFHYDPHSKHYTGQNKLLKGWCSRLRFAEKVVHMDFIHTPTGQPVYLSHDDNYLDLRERFFDVVKKFRNLFSFAPHKPLTFVLDRGIYGIDTFNKFINDKAENYFITWEKGFCADGYDTHKWDNSLSLYRAKNSSKDLKRYQFFYCDKRWSKQNDIRQIIVKAVNPNNNSIIVSILCNDLNRCAQDIINLMFDRWIQENDFKYLDVHFGINEITSYAVLSYKDIKKHLKDKQEKSGLYKALVKQRQQLKSRLKAVLLNEHCAKHKNKSREDKIAELTRQLEQLEQKIEQTEKEVSRLNRLSEEDFQKLDTSKKAIMDSVKILARNIFYKQLLPFKDAYDNFRDDHMLFRHLTRAPGLIHETDNGVEIILIPQACFPPKVITIFNSLLETLNQNGQYLPDGKQRKLTMHLQQDNKNLFNDNQTNLDKN